MRFFCEACLHTCFLYFSVQFFDHAGELMDLPEFVRQFFLELGNASGELFDPVPVGRSRSLDHPLHALVLDLDQFIELTDGRLNRRDSFLVDDSDRVLA